MSTNKHLRKEMNSLEKEVIQLKEQNEVMVSSDRFLIDSD